MSKMDSDLDLVDYKVIVSSKVSKSNYPKQPLHFNFILASVSFIKRISFKVQIPQREYPSFTHTRCRRRSCQLHANRSLPLKAFLAWRSRVCKKVLWIRLTTHLALLENSILFHQRWGLKMPTSLLKSRDSDWNPSYKRDSTVNAKSIFWMICTWVRIEKLANVSGARFFQWVQIFP